MNGGKRVKCFFRWQEKGLSATELLIALAVLGVALALAYFYYESSFSWWRRASADLGAVEEARLVLARLSQEVRVARKATAAGAPVAVRQGSGVKELVIYADVDKDSHPEEVHYGICDDGTLRRLVLKATTSSYPYQYPSPPGWTTWQKLFLDPGVTVDYSASFFSSTQANFGPLVEATLVFKKKDMSRPYTASIRAEVRSRKEAD